MGNTKFMIIKKTKQDIGEFNIVGSLRLSNFLFNKKNLEKISVKKKRYIINFRRLLLG